MYPLLGPEMAQARVEELRRDGQTRARRVGRARAGRSGAMRFAIGVRLVSLGLRLLGEPVRFDRARVR